MSDAWNLDDAGNPVADLDFPPEVEAEMRELITRVGGEFWGRDELPMGTRSLATMAILCTRGLHEELAIHVRLGQEQFGVSRKAADDSDRCFAHYLLQVRSRSASSARPGHVFVSTQISYNSASASYSQSALSMVSTEK